LIQHDAWRRLVAGAIDLGPLGTQGLTTSKWVKRSDAAGSTHSLQDTHIDIDIDGKIDKRRKIDRTIER